MGHQLKRNSLTLLSASAVGQLVSLATYPLLTRLFLPDEMGELSVLLAVVGLLSIASSLQYENAIMIEPREDDVNAVTALCLVLNTSFSLLTLLVVLLLHSFHLVGTPALLLPLLLWLSALTYVLSYRLNCAERFSVSALYQATEKIVSSLAKILFGFLGWHTFGLVAGQTSGQAVGALTLLRGHHVLAPVCSPAHLRSYVSRFRVFLSRHRQFPLSTLPQKELNALAVNLPVLVLSAAFGMTEVGFFSVAVSVGLRPVWSLGRAVQGVYFQRMGAKTSFRDYNVRLFRGVCINFAKWAIPSIVILYLLLPALTTFVFGQQWTRVGALLQTMLPWIAVSTLLQILSFIPNIYHRQRQAFLVEIVSTLLEALALVLGILSRHIEFAVSLLSITCSLLAMAQLTWYYLIIRNAHSTR